MKYATFAETIFCKEKILVTMKHGMKMAIVAVMAFCCSAAMADKREGMATVMLKNGSRISNVQIKVPKHTTDKKIEINDGKKRVIQSADVKRLYVWRNDHPRDVVEMVFTQCYYPDKKKGRELLDTPYWFILMEKGPHVAHWVTGTVGFGKQGCEIMYPSLDNNYFWKATEQYPMHIVFQSGDKATIREICEYLKDDPHLVQALNEDHGKNFKIRRKSSFYMINPLTNKDKVTNVNLWDYGKIVQTYAPKKH